MEIVNDRLRRRRHRAQRRAALLAKAAQARVAAAHERLEVLRLAEEKRRDVMLRTAPVERDARTQRARSARVGAELGAARASEREGLQVLMTEREAYRVNQRATVKAPPGAILYSIVVGSDAGGGGRSDRAMDRL